MNNMAVNTYLWTKSIGQTKQRRTETESWIWEAFCWLPDGKGCGGMGEEVTGLSTYRQLQISHGCVQYSIGNGVAKELIHMTQGHE